MEPNRECPRFDRYGVNNCPLTAKYLNWSVSPEDAERKCQLGKKRRFAIGLKTNLKFNGLTPREFAAMKRQESLTPEQRQKQLESIEKARSNSGVGKSEKKATSEVGEDYAGAFGSAFLEAKGFADEQDGGLQILLFEETDHVDE